MEPHPASVQEEATALEEELETDGGAKENEDVEAPKENELEEEELEEEDPKEENNQKKRKKN